MLSAQAEQIKEQVAETEACIERELREFEERRNIETEPGYKSADKPEGLDKETAGEHHAESSAVPLPPQSDSTNVHSPLQVTEPSSTHVVAERDSLEENGEVVVEGDEDTVIY